MQIYVIPGEARNLIVAPRFFAARRLRMAFC
jgi:hypothetical protein